jgi:hypothetical protein
MIGRKVTPDPGPVGAAGLPRLGDDGVDLVPRVRQRLTPQAEDVGPRAATRYASADEPPTETGIVPFVGRTRLRKLSNL